MIASARTGKSNQAFGLRCVAHRQVWCFHSLARYKLEASGDRLGGERHSSAAACGEAATAVVAVLAGHMSH